MKKMTDYKRIGEKMKKLRKESRKTQFEIAEKLFIHPKHYGKIERGCVEAKLDTFERFAKIYNVDLRHLLEKPCSDSPEEIIAKIHMTLTKCKTDDLWKILQMVKIFNT